MIAYPLREVVELWKSPEGSAANRMDPGDSQFAQFLGNGR